MILVDSALRARQAEGHPVRVALVGAGFMGRGVADQVVNRTPGMELVAVSNRHLAGAHRAYAEAGVEGVEVADDAAEVSRAVARGVPVVTEDASALCAADGVDVVCDVTGAVEFGARVTLDAFAAGKHVVTLNAELDGTVGPLLAHLARQAGVVFSGASGDQPGVELDLHRFVTGLGLEPLVCGNIKGLQDPYRTPTTQEGFARRWGQDPAMVTSFADGTKVSFEQAVVANATGMTVARRGMGGADHRGHVDELVGSYDVEALRGLGGVVDYVVGAQPGPGVFVLAATEHPRSRHYLELYKLGQGPLYSFTTPYHLCHFEVPTSLARAVLFGDAVVVADGAPRVEVVATAKRDLPAGHVLDGLGGYDTYGEAETAAATREGRLLPMGVAEGCRLTRQVHKDEALCHDDVELPPGRLVDALRQQQAELFRGLTSRGQAPWQTPRVPSPLSAALFDMDGLLVDTEPLWTVAEEDLARHLGQTWSPELKAQVVGSRVDAAVPTILRFYGLPVEPELVAATQHRLLATVAEQFRGALPLMPGAQELLAALAEQGVPCALVSSSYRVLVDAVLSHGYGPFALSVAGDEVDRAKPDPEPYLRAAAALGVDPGRCVVLEDSVVGVAAGLAAGAAVVAVPSVAGVRVPAHPHLLEVPSLTAVSVDTLRAMVGSRAA